MGFNPRLAPYTLNHVWTHDPGADEIFSLFRFPVAGRVLDAYATNTAAIATATNTLALRLLHYSSAATPLLITGGTLGSWAAGSTWAVDIPRQMTKTAYGSSALFTAGQWLRLQYDEASTGTWTEMGFQVDYILGYDVGSAPAAGTGPSED